MNKSDEKNIQTEIILNENISAPLEYLEKVGVQKCYLNGELVGEVDLLVNQKIESKDVWDFLIEAIDLCCKFGR